MNEGNVGRLSAEQVQKQLLQAAGDYFRSHPGFRRLLNGLVEKYRSLGRLGGVVVMKELDTTEQTELEAFLRCRLSRKEARVSAQKFVQALAETRFGGLDPLAVLAAWHGGELVSKQTSKARREQARREVLHRLLQEFPQPFCRLWLEAALRKHPATHRLQQAFERDPQFAVHMRYALQALGNLPEQYRRLPVFASEVCGDPHGLDGDSETGKLFLTGLKFVRDHFQELTDGLAAGIQAGSIAGNSGGNGKYATGQSMVDTLSATEEISELLYQFKLLRDDMLNFATCFGLAGYDSGQEVVYWRAASEAGAPLNLPLREIVKVTAVKPLNASWLDDDRFDVFVVENSGVFSALLDKFLLNGNWDAIPPLICLHGQFKLASWALLERLAQSGARFLYSGDFDPEGLQMAQKLLGRYPGKVCLWRMKTEDYQQATPAVPIEDMRLNKLRSVTHPELMDVTAAIFEQKLAAYQEGIIELLFQDINDKLTH